MFEGYTYKSVKTTPNTIVQCLVNTPTTCFPETFCYHIPYQPLIELPLFLHAIVVSRFSGVSLSFDLKVIEKVISMEDVKHVEGIYDDHVEHAAHGINGETLCPSSSLRALRKSIHRKWYMMVRRPVFHDLNIGQNKRQ